MLVVVLPSAFWLSGLGVESSVWYRVMFGFGALFGSVSGGWAMTGFGPQGLPYMLAIAYLMLTIGVIQRQFMLQRQEP